MTLPPGFRFHPTDEELVDYYLTKRVKGNAIEFDVVADVDLYKCEPWDLPPKSRLPDGDSEWFFFSPRDRKYPNGSRTNRATEKGYWKATGRDRPVKRGGDVIGMKKTLVFYTGRAPHGTRTNWLMHEYRLDGEQWEETNVSQDGFVLCRVFKKSALDLSLDPSPGTLHKNAVVPDVEKNPVFSEIEIKPALILQGGAPVPAPAPQPTTPTQLSTSRAAGRAEVPESGEQHDDDNKSGEDLMGTVLSFPNEEAFDVADLHKIGSTIMDDSWMKFTDDEEAFLGVVPPVSNRTSDAKNEFSRTWMQEHSGGEYFEMDNPWSAFKVEDCITDLLTTDNNNNFISLEMMPPLEAAPESPGPLAFTPETAGVINRRQRLSSPAAVIPSSGGTAKRRVLFQRNSWTARVPKDSLPNLPVGTHEETAAHLEKDAVAEVIEKEPKEQRSDESELLNIITAGTALGSEKLVPSSKSLIESGSDEDVRRSNSWAATMILPAPPDDLSVDDKPIRTLSNNITPSTAGDSVSTPLVFSVNSTMLSATSDDDEPDKNEKEIGPDLETLKAQRSEIHHQNSISVVGAESSTRAKRSVLDLVSQKSGAGVVDCSVTLFYQPASSIESPSSIRNHSNKLKSSTQFPSGIISLYASFVSVIPSVKTDGWSKVEAGVRSRDRKPALNVPCAQILPDLWRALAADAFSKQHVIAGTPADEDLRKRPQVVFEWDLPSFSIRFFTELFRQVVATGVQIMTEVGGL